MAFFEKVLHIYGVGVVFVYVIKVRYVLIVLFVVSILVAIWFGGVVADKYVPATAKVYNNVIVVDAGHGLPDGGATDNGIVESDLNLQIAKKLEVSLIDAGFEVIMTREDENNIADGDAQNSIAKTKNSDLNNRVKIINESNACIGISIHLNKYSSSKYWGWQTFYSENSEEGKRLAVSIQSAIGECVNRENSRTALKIDGIKIIDKTNIPVVIVECGFISNVEEARLLQDEEYQEKLVEGICLGVERFLGAS